MSAQIEGDGETGATGGDLQKWLKAHKLESIHDGLVEQGFEDLEDLEG